MSDGSREHKDRLFRFIFANPEHKEWTLSLYNALNHSHYTNIDDLEYTTIEEAVYLGMKNDVSFILMNTANFWEHQASFNPNIPVRLFIYAARVYDAYMIYHDMYRYGVVLQKLPKPKCVCFYNGTDDQPETKELRFSDAFGGTDGDIEVRVHMVNVNYGHNHELMESCKPMKEYAWLIDEIRRNQKKMRSLDAAVDAALDEMPDDFVLKKFLLSHRAEVKGMYLTEYNEEKERKLACEEAALIAHEEGINEDRHRVAEDMLRENYPVSAIEKISRLPEKIIMEIAKSIGVQAI